MDTLVEKVIQGDRASIAQAITLAEKDPEAFLPLLRDLQAQKKVSHRIGIAGPPGAGKSTLIAKLTELWRADQNDLGIIAIDPSSDETGGAFLGDRVRQKSTTDEDIFFRSVATRGSTGGISISLGAIITILEASRKNKIVIETTGIGQTDTDIADYVDTLVIVLVPESGDYIQALKAGYMEEGDIYVVHKSDREGAYIMKSSIEETLRMSTVRHTCDRPTLLCSSHKDSGIDSLHAHIEEHFSTLTQSNQLESQRKSKLKKEIFSIVHNQIRKRLQSSTSIQSCLEDHVDQVLNGNMTAWEVAKEIISHKL